jgi:hypothetical protein
MEQLGRQDGGDRNRGSDNRGDGEVPGHAGLCGQGGASHAEPGQKQADHGDGRDGPER